MTPEQEIKQLKARLALLEKRAQKPLTIEAVRRMDPDEINERWEEVQRVLDGGTDTQGTGPEGALTRDDLKRMDGGEINARWDEVQAVMAGKEINDGTP